MTPANVGEVVETRPQVDANAPSQLIREICNRVSYPRASKSSSRANPRVAEKRSTPARARQGVGQGKGAARKKAAQGGVSRKGSDSELEERVTVRSAIVLHPAPLHQALLPPQTAVW